MKSLIYAPIALLGLWILFGAQLAFSAEAENEIAPLDRALTLAQFAPRDAIHTLAVVSADATHVSGIDLSRHFGRYPDDVMGMVRDVGIAKLAQVVQRRSSGKLTRISRSALLPIVHKDNNIAVGTNYAEHGEEANIDTPFIFPKIAAPSGHRHRLAHDPEWLLDYEVELAVVFDRDIALASDLDNAYAGFFLTNDFTERATLIRQADLENPRAGAGFADAKGQEGYFPNGPWVVVPLDDWRTFYKEIELHSFVNGEPRQEDVASSMIWDIDTIISKILETGGKGVWRHNGEPVELYANYVPADTAILTGTPAGVVFNAPGTFYLARQSTRWAATLSFREEPLMEYVRERLIIDQRKKDIFLGPGDEVTVKGTYLGEIRTTIVDP